MSTMRRRRASHARARSALIRRQRSTRVLEARTKQQTSLAAAPITRGVSATGTMTMTTETTETTGRRPMLHKGSKLVGPSALAAALAIAWPAPGGARVTKSIIDRAQALAGQSAAETPYETITGRAFGELDPMDEHNTLITDINLAPRNANGKVEYTASFFIVKPVDMSKSSGLMWHDVPNRGGRITISSDLRTQGDIGLSSAWQGDNAGANATAVPANASSQAPVTPSNNEWVKTPVLNGVTGQILGRIVNRSGLTPAPLNVMGNPIPYFPANPSDNSGATLKVHLK